MIELYTHPQSPCAQKVRIVLAEKSLEWTKHHISLPDKENLKPEYLKLNPLGVVPTLVDDGKPVIESSIICEFLDDKYAEPALRPDDPHKRSQMRFWMKHIDNKLHPSCGALQWPLLMRPRLMELTEDEREAVVEKVIEKPRRERQKRLVKMGLDAPDVKDGVATYLKTIADMDATLAEQSWLAGDAFSLADAAMAPYFQTLYQFDWVAMYEANPRVADWYDRCRARGSYQSAVTADFPDDALRSLRDKGRPAWEKIKIHLQAA